MPNITEHTTKTHHAPCETRDNIIDYNKLSKYCNFKELEIYEQQNITNDDLCFANSCVSHKGVKNMWDDINICFNKIFKYDNYTHIIKLRFDYYRFGEHIQKVLTLLENIDISTINNFTTYEDPYCYRQDIFFICEINIFKQIISYITSNFYVLHEELKLKKCINPEQIINYTCEKLNVQYNNILLYNTIKQKKKMCILLVGLSYVEDYVHWSGKKYTIDFRLSYQNIKEKLFDCFNELYDIDIIICTNNNKYEKLLKEIYNPIHIIFNNSNKNCKNIECLNYFKSIYNDYDAMIYTRPDIYFNDSFDNVNLDKINIVSILEKNDLIDDNFYYIPYTHMHKFINVLIKNIEVNINNNTICHHLKHVLENICNIHYLKNENVVVNKLSFYKLIKCNESNIKKTNGIILDNKNDKYMYTNFLHVIKNTNANIKNNYLQLFDSNEYQIKKHKTDTTFPFIWFGYAINLNYTCAELSFDIYMFSTKFPKINIKTHQPQNLYNEWVNECKYAEYVNIRVPIYLNKKQQYVIFIMDDINCEIEFKIKNVKITKTHQINFVSFYTEGHPKDDGINLSDAKNILREKNNYIVDNQFFYTKNQLYSNPETRYLVNTFNEEQINGMNYKLNTVGFGRYKPYIILEELKKVNFGDIIFFRDCNVIKYPDILCDIENSVYTINYILNTIHTSIYVPIEYYPTLKIEQHSKKEVLNFFGFDNYQFNNQFLYNASIIICKKTELVLKIINEWNDVCKNDNLLSISYDKNIQSPNFKWHTSDQSILGIILKKYTTLKLLPYNFPTYGFPSRERKLTILNIIKIPKIAILLVGEMRNYDNNNIINNNNKFLFEKYQCDIFVSTWTKRGFSPCNLSIKNKVYKDDNVTIDDIYNTYKNVKAVNIESYENWKNSLSKEYENYYNQPFIINGQNGSNTVFPQLYKLHDANKLKNDFEKQNNFKYDMVFRFRPDMCLVEDIQENYIIPFKKHFDSDTNNKMWTLNPYKIFYPNRIYDIFFYCNSEVMNIIADSYEKIIQLINNKYNNGLQKNDTTRILYIHAIENNITIIENNRCIGDIYRDEPFSEYLNKIKNIWN